MWCFLGFLDQAMQDHNAFSDQSAIKRTTNAFPRLCNATRTSRSPWRGSAACADQRRALPSIRPSEENQRKRRPARHARQPARSQLRALMACLRWHPVSATNSSRIFCFSLLNAPRYRVPTASVNSLRVVMLIRLCLVTLFCPRRTIRRVANYMRQQGISGNKTDESMRQPG